MQKYIEKELNLRELTLALIESAWGQRDQALPLDSVPT